MSPRHFRYFLALISALTRIRPLSLAYNLAAYTASHVSLREEEMLLVRDRLTACAPSISCNGNPALWATAYRENMGVAALNTYLFREMTPDWLGRRIHVLGEAHLQSALSQNKGLLILTAHQHHLVFLGVAMGLLGLKTNPILLDPSLTVPDFLEPYMGRMLGDSERLFNGGRYLIVDLQNQFIRQIYRVFEAKEIIISANDFPNDLAPKRRIDFPFLNQNISIPYGSIKIAVEHEVQIVSAFLHWRGGDQFVLSFTPIDSASVLDISATYTRQLEQAVKTDPGGWEGWKWGALFRTEAGSA